MIPGVWRRLPDAGWLRPCPFHDIDELHAVTEEPYMVEETTHNSYSIFIYCPWCGTRGPHTGTEDDAVDYWNRKG